MRNTLERLPFTIGGHTFTPAETGTEKLHRLTVPMTYSGKAAQTMLDFLTTVAGDTVQAVFSLGEGDERPKKRTRKAGDDVTVTGKIAKKATVTATGEGLGSFGIVFGVVGDDTRGIRELVEFAVEAARVEALEVIVSFELVQPALPLGEEDGETAAA